MAFLVCDMQKMRLGDTPLVIAGIKFIDTDSDEVNSLPCCCEIDDFCVFECGETVLYL